MKVIDTTAKNTTTAKAEVNHAHGSVLFASTLKISEFTTETICITVKRANNGKDVVILKEDVNLAQFLATATLAFNPIGSNPTHSTSCVVNITTGGNIPLQDSDNVTYELKGLKGPQAYIIDTIQAGYIGTTAFTYEKRNFPKDNTIIDFNVNGYDCGVLALTDDIVAVELGYSTGTSSNHTIEQFVELMHQSNSALHICNGTIERRSEKFVQIPFVGISRLTIKKDNATAVTNLLVRTQLVNN